MILWGQLSICLLVIGIAGYWLSRCGGEIGAHTGMGGSWIGFTLLAGVTTLPEMVTSVSALRLANAPDIAVGGLLGSVVFNLAILVVLESLARGELYQRAASNHALPAALGAAMLALVGTSLLLEHAGLMPALAHLGLYTPLILAGWLVAMRVMFQQERAGRVTAAGKSPPSSMSLRAALGGYGASAVVVVAAGSWLPFVAKGLAQAHGWEQSFVGTLLVAAITSAPEMAVTLSAARLGALDMAIGNVLGANLLNLALLGLGDLIYTGAPLLSVASLSNSATAGAGLLMSLLVVAGLRLRVRRLPLGRLSWVGALLLPIYLANSALLYFWSPP